MTTTVVKTIGTSSRDYSTLQAWEDACPADLVAVDQIWQGQCYNDSEFTGGLGVAGTTTSATQYKELTTAAGQSFSDNASVQANALRYNQANGVAISVAGGYSTAIGVSDINFRMSKVQVKVSSDGYPYDNNTGSTAHILDKCILQQSGSNGACVRLRGGYLSNSLLSKNSAGTSKAAITGAYGGATLTNCTIVRPTTYAVGGTAIVAELGFAFTLKNVAVFGFTADTSGTISATTCYTDDSTPTTGFTTVAYNTSTGSGFQNTAVTTADFRIKTGSALLDVGTTDTTYAATDIAGTARPQGSAYDVGAWELVASSAAALAGNASGQASGTGSLTTAIPITAAALSLASASSALSSGISLGGIAVSIASASGALTAQIRITAGALAQAISSAALSSGIIMSAAAVSQAAAQGTLATAIRLIASATGQATASASLTAASSGLSAAAQAQSSAGAALTIQIQLAASALAQATATASLTATGGGLSATATAQSAGSGALTTQIKISAAALAEAIAAGGLTARIDLAANAINTANASAWLLTAVQLAADASVIADATAALTGGSLSVVRYQALTADIFPIALTADIF